MHFSEELQTEGSLTQDRENSHAASQDTKGKTISECQSEGSEKVEKNRTRKKPHLIQ